MRLPSTLLIIASLTFTTGSALGQSLSAADEAYARGDYAAAAENLRPIAEEGLSSGQYKLGFLYDSGQGVPQSYVEAAKWYRRAAEQGDAAAQALLGIQYYKDEGVRQDRVMAYILASLAAAQGVEQARELRDLILEDFSREQVTEAQRLTSEWQVGTPLPTSSDTKTWP
ncbi:tetratricopeptide repeat protein [Halomonas sp.]|jgi:TPR repeat protein|uniref:tetratricopeptide repeat protein n=1 Tax=Halomonas sp. TaxID=1486246 RepID=UPI003562E958